MSRTSESVARDIMQSAVVADEDEWIAYAAAVIEEVRADAKTEGLREAMDAINGESWEPWNIYGAMEAVDLLRDLLPDEDES